MFIKRKKKPDAAELEGVVTFFGSHHALKGESVLKKNNIPSKLIPGPREISPNCGTALRFDYIHKKNLPDLLSKNDVLFDTVIHYPEERGKQK